MNQTESELYTTTEILRYYQRARDLVPVPHKAYVLIWAFHVDSGLRKNRLAEWKRERYSADAADKPADGPKTQSPKH